NPVPTVSNDLRQPVYLNLSNCANFATCTMNDRTTGQPYTVPAGKRLVIESASGWFETTHGQGQPWYIALQPNHAMGDQFVYSTTLTIGLRSGDLFVFGQKIAMFSEPGTQVKFTVELNAPSASFSNFINVYGHLEDI